MSRAAFARRFTSLVGEAPLAYLTRWRLNLAAQRLYARWAAQGARVLQQIFDGGRLPHDIIDNFRGNVPVDRIYPAILDFVEQADALAVKV